MALDAAHSTLVLVDYQQRLMPAIHRGTEVIDQALRLAQGARALSVPIVGTEQNPRGLGANVTRLREHCDPTLSKMHFDACPDGLLAWLRRADLQHRSQVVVAGCEAHVCLMQTALGLLRDGRPVWVVADASGSRRADDHAMAMAHLRQAGARIVGVEMVLFEWLGTCEHPRFKDLLAIVKAAPG